MSYFSHSVVRTVTKEYHKTSQLKVTNWYRSSEEP